MPESVDTVRDRLAVYFDVESRRKGLALHAKPTDVILSDAQKSGTTWIRQILHALRSRGDMEYEEACMVVPSLEGAAAYGYGDVNQPQRFFPRMFSTHMNYEHVPKGAAKYIFSMRDPHDSAASYYHYLSGWVFSPEDVSMDDFVQYVWLARGDGTSQDAWPSQLHHIASWYPHRLDDNVLWLHFEDLKEDLPGVIKKIAKFLDIGVADNELLELVEKQASIDFMKQHHSKFDCHIYKKTRNIPMGLPADAGLNGHCGRVRSGKSGMGKQELSSDVIELIDKKWNTIIEPLTGCANYAELRASIKKELELKTCSMH